jgi:hypothetical protein
LIGSYPARIEAARIKPCGSGLVREKDVRLDPQVEHGMN